MNPQDPLAALHPLREPALVGWWPLAPGWWAIIVLTVLAIAMLCYYLLKRYRANVYRRLALQQLQGIRTSMDVDGDKHCAVSDTNALLKAVALRVFPRHKTAALSGEAWLAFLNKTRRSESADTAFPSDFADAAYRAQTPNLDTDQLFRAAKHWVAKHGAPR